MRCWLASTRWPPASTHTFKPCNASDAPNVTSRPRPRASSKKPPAWHAGLPIWSRSQKQISPWRKSARRLCLATQRRALQALHNAKRTPDHGIVVGAELGADSVLRHRRHGAGSGRGDCTWAPIHVRTPRGDSPTAHFEQDQSVAQHWCSWQYRMSTSHVTPPATWETPQRSRCPPPTA